MFIIKSGGMDDSQATAVKNKKPAIFSFCAILIFAVSTFILMFYRAPFWDEANSWMIAKSFDFFELFEVSKYDGHLFLWFLLQAPFAKNDFFYPVPIYIMNWAFCLGALIVLWKKAPFDTLEKTLITFSFPFFWYFAQVARCYSVGIFLLFIVLALWKNRQKYPVLIPILIVLAGNSSVMALIGAFALGLIILLEGNKKAILIFALGAIIVGAQIFGAGLPSGRFDTSTFPLTISRFLFLPMFESWYNFFMRLFSLVVVFGFFIAVAEFYKAWRALFFFLLTGGLLVLIFLFGYQGSWWNYLFFFVYFLISIWLSRAEGAPCTKGLRAVFLLILSLFFLKTLTLKFAYPPPPIVYDGQGQKVYELLKETDFLDGTYKIYLLDSYSDVSVGVLPYLKVKTYNLAGEEKYSIKGIRRRYMDDLNRFSIDEIASAFENNKKNIGMSAQKTAEKIGGKDKTLFLDLIYQNNNPGLYIYSLRIEPK